MPYLFGQPGSSPFNAHHGAKLEATHLRGRKYAVRPIGQLGTCGFFPIPWTVCYVSALDPASAIRKAIMIMNRSREHGHKLYT